MKDIHVLVITGRGIFFIGGHIEFSASGDGNVLVANSVSGTDFRSFLGMEVLC